MQNIISLDNISGNKSQIKKYFDKIRNRGDGYILSEKEYRNLFSFAKQFAAYKVEQKWTHAIVKKSPFYGSKALCLNFSDGNIYMDISIKTNLYTVKHRVLSCLRSISIIKSNLCHICGSQKDLHFHHVSPTFSEIASIFIEKIGEKYIEERCDSGKIIDPILLNKWESFHNENSRIGITVCKQCHVKIHKGEISW